MAEGMVIGADGVATTLPTKELSAPDAHLLREYKKFLRRTGLREALYCNRCFEGLLSDGCEAHVTDADILIKCRCTLRFYKGQAY